GAAVALVACANPIESRDTDIDVLVIPTRGLPDQRIEVVGSAPAEVIHSCGTLIVLADDVANDPEIVANARKLASKLGGQIAGSPSAARAGVVSLAYVVDRTTPMAAELVVAIGGAAVDVSGATALIKIGAQGGKMLEGVLSGPPGPGLAA